LTVRAIVIGLLGGIILGAVGYWADHAARLNRFVSGQFPISIFAPLVVVVLLLNPLASRVRRRWRLGRAELATIIIAMLAACFVPGNGLLRYFTRMLIMPIHVNQTSPAWQANGVLEDMPQAMLANRGYYDEALVRRFIEGSGTTGEPIAFGEVPWERWTQTLVFWLPLIVLFGVASVAMALIVHPQWSRHERLLYPIAEFANTMLTGPGQQPAYRTTAFKVAVAIVLLCHVNNGLAQYLSGWSIVIPRGMDFSSIAAKFPLLRWGWGGWSLQRPTIWPVAVALAFFLPRDVSFSVGISQPLATVVGAMIVHFGWVTLGGDFISGGPFQFQRAGGCIALALVLLYFGRRFYWSVLRRAVTSCGPPPHDAGWAVGACRVLLVCVAALTALLATTTGLAWPLALAFVVLTLLAYISVARITAEFGMFYVQIIWCPVMILMGIFGVVAIGPQALLVLAVLSVVFVAQPEESVMTFVVQGLRIGEVQRLPERRSGLTAMTVVVLVVLIAVPVALWVDYSYGSGTRSWAARGMPRVPYNALQGIRTDLRLDGTLDAAVSAVGWERVANIKPDRRFLFFAGIGAGLLIVTYMLRLRFRWWPLHPILFLVWETWASALFFASFLLGWLIKSMVSTSGSHRAMQTGRHFMVGVLAGELLGGILWMLVGTIYFFITRTRPPYYNIFPF